MALAFASRLVERLSGAAKAARFTRLKDDEKRAVMRLLHAVALADGVLSAAETKELARVAGVLGVRWDEIGQQGLPEGVSVLSKSERTMRVACLLVADAFFVDGDYDASEEKFVDSFGERFQLPSNPLKEAVERLRKKKLDEALEEWNAEIA